MIRQGQAKVHRYGRADPQDGWDGFFASQASREVAEAMLARGRMDTSAAAVVNGEVMVHVEVWGTGGVGDLVATVL